MLTKSGKPRDSRKAKLYRAEKVLETADSRLETVAEIEEWCEVIRRSRWFSERYPWVKRIDVYDGRGRRRAGGWGTPTAVGIKMPKWSRFRAIVLHEISHGLQPSNTAAHGREFCNIYLQLVRRFMGDEAWKTLKDSFRKEHVRWANRREGNARRIRETGGRAAIAASGS